MRRVACVIKGLTNFCPLEGTESYRLGRELRSGPVRERGRGPLTGSRARARDGPLWRAVG